MSPKAITFARFVWILGLSLLITSPLRAQVAGATLTGTIADAMGAAVPNATVSVTNSATGVVVNTTTNPVGAYTVPNLNAGEYRVIVSAPGFGATAANLTLTVGQKQELNLALAVGALAETVVVTAAAPQVELTNSTISGIVSATTLRELPLNGRDWASLATLQPGVASVRTHPMGTQATRGLGLHMTVSGGRPTQNSYRLDGALVNDYSNAGPGSVLGQNLGVDAIQEFSVLTSNYSAEYGFTSGGVINAVTRSGSNTFHGSVFDFLRNDKLDAANFFNNANGLPKQPLKQNQFGASAGGRILRDKLFLFGDYEGVRQAKGTPQTQFTISDAVRAGRVTNLSNGVATTVPIDPYIRKYLGFFPPPNGSPNCVGCNANVGAYNWTAVQHTTENFITTRGDLKISDKDSLFATFVRDPSDFSLPQALNQVSVKFAAYRQADVLEETHTFSPSVVNTIRVALDKTNGKTNNYYDFASQAINPLAADTSLNMRPGVPGHGAPLIVLSSTGITPPGQLWGATHQDLWNQIFQVYDDAFVTRGSHGLKFGFTLLAQQNDVIAINNINGNGTFTAGLVTPVARDNCTRTGTSSIEASCGALVNFLTNQPRSSVLPADLAASNKHYMRDKVFGGYIQDDWKVFPSLTLNLGLRYEMQTNPTEIHGEVGYLRTLKSPSTDLVNQFYVRNPTLKNFEPRIGFAWDPFHDGKTAVRGGVGIFDALPQPYINSLYNATTAPFLGSYGTVGPPGTAAPPAGLWPSGVPALAPAVKPTQVVWAYNDNNIKRNYVYQWNLNVQRQLTSSMTLVLGYAGSRGFHHPFLTEGANTVQPVNVGKPIPGVGYYWPIPWTQDQGVDGQAALYNPLVQIIRSTMWQARSYYNSLQVKLDKRMSRGFQVQGSFTWSKSIDDSSGSAAADTFSNEWNALPTYDLRLVRGLSAFNVGRNLVINGLWNAPAAKSLGSFGERVLGGWQLGLISNLSDGVPIMPSMGMDAPDMLGEIIPTLNPPNRVVGPGCDSPVNPRNPSHYLKPECFSMVPQTALNTPYCDTARALKMGFPGTCPNIRGDLGRNSIIGPGLFNVDFSMLKNNYIPRISETFNVQFRAEMFNVLNRANFAPPGLNPNTGGGAMQAIFANGQPNPQFGQIVATQTPARQIQFALKLVW
jgi:hypothetical protein